MVLTKILYSYNEKIVERIYLVNEKIASITMGIIAGILSVTAFFYNMSQTSDDSNSMEQYTITSLYVYPVLSGTNEWDLLSMDERIERNTTVKRPAGN